MRIQLASDIHLEFPAAVMDIQNVDGKTDVLILGGDICTTGSVRPRRKFFEDCASRFKNVVYLMGNHEHYKGDFSDTLLVLQAELMGIPNLHILEKSSVVIDGVPFWGATLWTDCNDDDPRTIRELKYGMNDYRLIDNTPSAIFSPADGMLDHRQALASLGHFLADNEGKKVVVCTHHAPSRKSVHPRYKDDYHINGGYSSDLERIMVQNPNIVLWTHGHTHDSFDYMVEKTRVVANPAGYQMRSGIYENPKFDVAKVIEI